MTDDDPISRIEEEHGRMDTGRCSYLMLKGALDVGATIELSFVAVAAYYAGMFAAMRLEVEVDEDEREDS